MEKSENNETNNEQKGGPSFIKLLIYVGVVVAWFLVSFRSCVGCGSSNGHKNAKETSSTKAKMECEYCGKTYNSEDKYYDSETGINYTCCSNCCAKCYAKISKENDKKALREGIKKARNKWVDDNPNEARRRGIHKF